MTKPLLSQIAALLIGVQVNQYTPVTPTIAIDVSDPEFEDITPMLDRANTGRTAGPAKGKYPGEPTATIKFTTEFQADAAGLTTGFAALLNACGCELNAGVITAVTDTTLQKCLTLWLYEDGKCKKMGNAQAEATIKYTKGQIITVEFEFTGYYIDTIDVAMPATEAAEIEPLIAAAASIGGNDYNAVETTVKFNNVLSRRGNYYVVTSRAVSVETDPESQLVGTFDPEGLKRAGTAIACTLAASNGTAAMTISTPTATIDKVTEGERDGIRLDKLTMTATDPDGEDAWISITGA